MTYNIINIDLSHSRVNEVYNLSGDSIKVLNATSDCFIQFDDTSQDPINLLLIDEIKIKFKKFYISNVGIKNQSIKIVVSEDFSLCDRISISDYISPPAPAPVQTINITNSEPNVQIELNLSPLNFDKFNDDGSNIRIIDFNQNPIPFYLCDFNKVTKTGKLFFKTPNRAINKAIIYPDSLDAPSVSDGNATFEFFDDFTGTTIDSTKWNIVDATGWSVVNGELRGSNTKGRLLSQSLFSSGVILEIKTRTIAVAHHGQTIGGFWANASNGFSLTQRSDDIIRNDAVWYFILTNVVPEDNTDFLLQFITQSTAINLKITRLDTNIVTYNATHTNTVINEAIILGRRSDDHPDTLNQTYETYWDWVRVRKATTATAMIV